MKYFFLQADMGPAFWVGAVVIPVILLIISGLLKANISAEKEKRQHLEKDLEKLQIRIELISKEVEQRDRATNEKINNIILKIMEDMNSIGIKLEALKRDLKS